MELPKYLMHALAFICGSGGEDIGFALGHLRRETAHSYVSKLKGLGLAYTYYKERGCLEVWPTRTGTDLYQKHKDAVDAELRQKFTL